MGMSFVHWFDDDFFSISDLNRVDIKKEIQIVPNAAKRRKRRRSQLHGSPGRGTDV